MQGAKDVKGGDRLPRQLRCDIVGDASKTEHLDVQHLAGRLRGLQVLAAVVAQAEVKLVAVDGFPDGIIVPIELVSNGCPDEVGPVGVEALLHEEIDMSQVDLAQIDRDLLAIRSPWSKFVHVGRHSRPPLAICMDGIWMVGVASSSPSIVFP